jgi:protein gp37
MKTGIEWTDATWNPVRGCTRVSEGCRNCYAERVAARFSGPGKPYHGFAEAGRAGSLWTGKVELVTSTLAKPLRWRKPMRIFVNSMSDLFHESLPEIDVAEVFRVMARCPQHIFQILTKRPNVMLERMPRMRATFPDRLEHVWLGVSVEDQRTADERIPLLLQTPATVRFVSYEPALGPVDFRQLNDGSWYDREGAQCYDALAGNAYYRDGEHGLGGGPRVDWLIVGGESGPGARRFDLAWARSVVEQCREAGVACFVKQLGSNPQCGSCLDGSVCWCGERLAYIKDRKGGDMAEWPEDLRVREVPA